LTEDTGLGPIPDGKEALPPDRIWYETAPGAAPAEAPVPAPKKRGRKPGSTVKKKAAAPVAETVRTTCSIRMRLLLRAGQKSYAILVNNKLGSPEQVRAQFDRWAGQLEKMWAKF
jgi:hypothetical protein